MAVGAVFALLRCPAVPFSLLLLRNYLIVFGAPGRWSAVLPVLSALFGASRGAVLAYVGQIYRPKFGRGLPPVPRWAAWPGRSRDEARPRCR